MIATPDHRSNDVFRFVRGVLRVPYPAMARRQIHRRRAGVGLIAALVLTASSSARLVAAAPEAAATQPNEKVWELTDYLKGTAPQIRDLVNGELERLLAIRKGREALLAKSNADLAAIQAKLLDALHKTPNYQRVVAETKAAQADLEALRRDPASPAQKKMDASSRYNQLRASADKLEKDALAADKDIARLRREAQDYQADLKRNEKSVETARKWRDQLIPAIRTTYRLRWPVRRLARDLWGSYAHRRDRLADRRHRLRNARIFTGEAPRGGNRDLRR